VESATQPRLKTKPILVPSKRDGTPLVADFTRLQNDTEYGTK